MSFWIKFAFLLQIFTTNHCVVLNEKIGCDNICSKTEFCDTGGIEECRDCFEIQSEQIFTNVCKTLSTLSYFCQNVEETQKFISKLDNCKGVNFRRCSNESANKNNNQGINV